MPVLEELYKVKKEWAGWELIREIGLKMHDDNSILYNAAKMIYPYLFPALLMVLLVHSSGHFMK